MPAPAPGETFRFNDFELDVAAYQLRRQGRVVRLERQPMDVLILLVERRRQLVSRADIVERLWGTDVFVDVDTGVHTAIRKIRQALGDSISAPAFVETVPSKGYRFVAEVEVVPTDDVAIRELHGRESFENVAAAPVPAAGSDTAPASPRWSAYPARVLMAAAAVALVTGLAAWTRLNGGVPASRVTLAVLPFEYLGSDPEREYLAAGLTEETSASLAQIDLEHLIVKGLYVGLPGHRKDGRGDRPGTLGRLSFGEYASSGGQPAACDHHADSCGRSGACLVAVGTIEIRPASWACNKN